VDQPYPPAGITMVIPAPHGESGPWDRPTSPGTAGTTRHDNAVRGGTLTVVAHEGGRMVAREAIVLAAREVIVLIVVVAFLLWAAHRVVRESRR